ncbi:MAG: TIGR03084 family metal-binding protein [Pseudomonadales bacterium]
MLQQAEDLREEGAELKKVLDGLGKEDWASKTPFKSWTVNQVVQHLHGADRTAVLALQDPDGFESAKADPQKVGELMNPSMEGKELLDTWWIYLTDMCDALGESDPKRRVPWFGPDMGVMMFTTARQMETWAHGQDIFDLFGQTRVNGARLKNIAVIGVRTYGWTFANRGMEPPGPPSHVRLTAPDGGLWEFNDPDPANMIEGDAVAFCHVVTQGRNIQDVDLKVVGEPASKWMEIAQCFAGPPEDPPAPGSRLVNFKKQ